MTYATGNPLAADDGPLPRREAREALGKGRIHPQSFRDNRRQVRQPLDRLGFDVALAGKGGPDLSDGLLERGLVPEQVEGDAREAGGGALAAGEDDERRVGVELLDRHRDALLAPDDVGEEVRVVRLGGDAPVDFVAVQAEDFHLAGLHRLGDHQSDNLVQRRQLLAICLGFSYGSSGFGIVTFVPDIDKGKRLERIEHELNPFREAGQFETFKRFAKGQISNQVKSGPDVPFEHVHRCPARCFDSFAQLVDQLPGEMLQDILLLQKRLVGERGQKGPTDPTVGLPFRGQDGMDPIRRRLKEGRILAEAFTRLAVTVDGFQGLDADVRELARRRSNNGTILFVQLSELRH